MVRSGWDLFLHSQSPAPGQPLVGRADRRAPRRLCRCSATPTFRDRDYLRAAQSPPLHLDPAHWRQRFSRPVAADQGGVLPPAASLGGPRTGAPRGRARRVAASLLGARDHRCGRSGGPHRLCSCESGQASPGRGYGRLAVFIVASVEEGERSRRDGVKVHFGHASMHPTHLPITIAHRRRVH